MNTELVEVIKKGGVAVMPTDTIYGIVARALDQEAVERVYQIRKRSPEKPCIMLIADISDASQFGVRCGWFSNTRRILKSVWPGAVSVILPSVSEKFAYLHRGTGSLAFRLPADESLRALLRKTGPLIAPSANPEGLVPAKTIDEARAYFGDQVDAYEDVGVLSGAPSTLVDITSGSLRILRQGSATIPTCLL